MNVLNPPKPRHQAAENNDNEGDDEPKDDGAKQAADDPEADTAAFKVLSNICKSFRASGPNLEGSLLPRNAGEYIVLLELLEGLETLGLRLAFD